MTVVIYSVRHSVSIKNKAYEVIIPMERYIVDRFEGEYAVLEREDGSTIDVLKEIVSGAEGDVVVFKDGEYCADKEETLARRRMIEEKMRKLFGER